MKRSLVSALVLLAVGRTAAAAGDAPHVLLFRPADFPTVDAPPIPDDRLDAALAGLSVDELPSVRALREIDVPARAARGDVLLLPHGSAYALEAWPAIRAFLDRGGSLVALGGAPFHQPVWSQPDHRPGAPRWVFGLRSPTAARALLIGPAEAVEVEPGPRVAALGEIGAQLPAPFPLPSRAWALTVRLGTEREIPGEEGSDSPRQAVLRPLVHVVDARGLPRSCPLVEIDHLLGSSAGGRWILAPSDAALPAPLIRAIVDRALDGAGELTATPVHATVAAGETPRITVRWRRPRPQSAPASAALVLRDPRGDELLRQTVALVGDAAAREATVELPARSLAPGIYRVDVELVGTRPVHAVGGFWVRDDRLLRPGPRLAVSRDWIRRDGRVFPIVGTSYMASDVHRSFLFAPNPIVWDRDFAEMKRQGVRFVRTGLWYGWNKAVAPGKEPGTPAEAVLRALEAYVHTAARHDIVVCFTFFAFQPVAFGGRNPYLDPRALAAQKTFVAAFARYFRGVGWIHWDLVNEPSYGATTWTNLPSGDEHERRAWELWVRSQHGPDPLALRDLWRDLGPDPLALPRPEDLRPAALREDRTPRKAIDFVRFSNDVVRTWAATLRGVVRAAGGDVLVTLGQDEGGTSVRPSQLLHAPSVDYTAIHTWWNNDDLLWDVVVTKTRERPSLVQETGVMRVDDLDGLPWRTATAAAALLERKLGYAFAGRAAGVVEWAWNINPYQPIDNEAVIGLFRPDGTAKPELDVLTDYAAFLRDAAPYLDDWAPDPVVVVVPQSRLFLGRPGGAVERLVRTLAERLGVVPGVVSDLAVSPERLAGARAILVPDPEVLDDAAASALLAASRAGAKVLITGAVEGDAYGRSPPALARLGVLGPSRPVAPRELAHLPGSPDRWVTFDGLAQERLRRSLTPSIASFAAAVIHEPLPLELAREPEPLVALLDSFLRAARVELYRSEAPIATRVLRAPRATLVVCVNETPADLVRRLVVDGRTLDIPIAAGRTRLVLLDAAATRVLVASPGAAVALAGAASS
jgi:hypothetical protein